MSTNVGETGTQLQQVHGALACDAVIEHLRQFGANARVLIVGRGREHLERDCLFGERGLVDKYRDEFGGVVTALQFTHIGGGSIHVATYRGIANANTLRGILFNAVWFENPPDDEEGREAVKMARANCRRDGADPNSGCFEIESIAGRIVGPEMRVAR